MSKHRYNDTILRGYDPNYVPRQWQTVSVKDTAKIVLSSCPDLDYAFVFDTIQQYDNGTVYSFEVQLWVEYFKQRMY